jgi:hypothetical protein
MRSLTVKLFAWSEFRGASMTSRYIKPEEIPLQNFQLEAGAELCKWSKVYEVINMANSVIKYAPEVRDVDATYTEGAMESHRTEAYFMRSLMYFYLVRNWRETPIVLEPYIDDSAPFSIAKSSEADIIAQIKKDITTALESGAAKERFENDTWAASKGRATKWALYALMADVCLWSEDYDKCIEYADLLINATATWRPVFMTNPDQWFEMFDPGNSNESIFEINWSASMSQTSGSPYSFLPMTNASARYFAPAMTQRLLNEATEAELSGGAPVRSWYGAISGYFDDMTGAVYKYQGSYTDGIQRDVPSANFIIYRMADVMLMKAEALIWKGGSDNWQTAMELINQIRVRANLNELNIDFAQASELSMLEILLNERDMEFAAEGKRWYDILRFGKSKNFKYKQEFIEIILENNATANRNWLRSALRNDGAWYMPIAQSELEVNELLVQNPYYN